MKTFPLRYRYTDWKETTLFERPDGGKVTRVEAEFSYEGELAGSTKLGYVMHYRPDETGSYDGWEQFDGSFEGKPASVLFRHEGTFDPKGVDVRVTSVEHTATGSLAHQRLGFSIRFEGHGPYELTLNVE